ncbi:HNH endonuclease signature motif containing protein [Paracoccus sp. PAR01]|uniref:HNH endonuclease signature motif containing protein n=1 Tax=Paracoccus sp. PAR01 TaxID=2769282 RepID=UPI00177AE89A|nr:HNH endonuclease signature motif containing protein [Paracoccus sp. PAR01]MBD9529020.1 HNH endonuclease [Paracoccus sp. PAR01]
MTGKQDGGAAFPICPGQEGAIADRFIRFVDMGDGDLSNCWNWIGAKSDRGYGVFTVKKPKQARAHRFSFQLFHGKEPSDLVLHLCDNPSCVNPTHLMDGNHGENMRQMAARKRAHRICARS